jgi:uncharacterized membrane protein
VTIRIRIVGAAQNFNLYLHRRKLSALFGCWLLAPAYLNATVVIALIHPDAIYIAADSRKTMTNERDSVMGISTTCKIHVVNGIAFAAAGLDSFDTIFNLRDVITAALQTSGYPRLTNKLVLLDRNLRTALAAPIR